MTNPVQSLATDNRTPTPAAGSEVPWPEMPNNLADYYHDCHIYDQNNQALFVSATFTGCFIGPDHSHETIFPNTCSHKTAFLHFEFTPSAWSDTVFDEKHGFSSPLHWDSNLDVESLTRLSFKSLAEHAAISSPSRTFTAKPAAIFGVRSSFKDNLTYPEGLDRTLPIFRLTNPNAATHLFIKIPWEVKEASPEHIKITSYTPLPGLTYWCTINDYYRIGVDYWLAPLIRNPPAP